MLHIALFFSLLLTFSAGCKSRSFGDIASESKEHTVPKTTLVYHWTTDPLAAINPEEYVFKELRGVAQKNEGGKSISDTLIMGAGIYSSLDPLSTYLFGNILLEIPIMAGSRYQLAPSNPGIQLVTSNIPILLYIYVNSGVLYKGSESVVIRSPSVIDFKALRAYDGRSPKALSEHKKLRSSTLSTVLNEYVDIPILLLRSFADQPSLAAAALSEIEAETSELKTIAEQNNSFFEKMRCRGNWKPRSNLGHLKDCKEAFQFDRVASLASYLKLYRYVDPTTRDSRVEQEVEAKMAADPRNVERIEELKKAVEAIKAEAKNTYTLANWPR